MKPTMYLGIDGPILVPQDMSNSVLGDVKIADYAKPFVHWAKEHFNVVWLTDRFPHEAFIVARKLGLKGDDIPVMGYQSNKTDGIVPDSHFVWVDAELIPGEVQWLGQHKIHEKFFQVDPSVGVTEEHKKAIGKLLKHV